MGAASGNTILPDVSLCAIVRDEMINSMGGIWEFVDSAARYVAEAIIVDTGSVDGTREALEEMQNCFKNLQVYDHTFDGFANSRNFSLQQVKTRWVLVLDADEKIKPGGYDDLLPFLDVPTRKKPKGYDFAFYDVRSDGTTPGEGQGPRLFEVRPRMHYWDMRGVFESLKWDMYCGKDLLQIDIPIYHHLPTPQALELKKKEWYSLFKDDLSKVPAPSTLSSFVQWKTLG